MNKTAWEVTFRHDVEIRQIVKFKASSPEKLEERIVDFVETMGVDEIMANGGRATLVDYEVETREKVDLVD